MKYNNIQSKTFDYMDKNSYNHINSLIPSISQKLHEDFLKGMGQRIGLASKELLFTGLQKAHEYNRNRHFRTIQYGKEVDDEIIHSQIQKASGLTPRYIQQIMTFGSPSEKMAINRLKSSVMQTNPTLAKYAKSSREFTRRFSNKMSANTARLNSPTLLSSIKNKPNRTISQNIKDIISVNPKKAASSLQRLRIIKNKARKQELLNRGANKYRISLETDLI